MIKICLRFLLLGISTAVFAGAPFNRFSSTELKPFTTSFSNQKEEVISDITERMNKEMEEHVQTQERNRKIMLVVKSFTGLSGFGMLGVGSWYSYDAQKSIDEQKKISDEYYNSKLGADFDGIVARFHTMDNPIQTKVERSQQFLGFGAGILLIWGFMLYAF